MSVTRRGVLAAALAAAGCAAPLPPRTVERTTPAAAAVLQASAAAHGAERFARLRDVSVSYEGQWRGLVGRLQPALVDAGHRGRSQERLLPGQRLWAQAHAGPDGTKQVVRQDAPAGTGTVRVWLDGAETATGEQRDAAALVADGYALFLLGPMLLAGPWAADRALVMELAGVERLERDDGAWECDVLRVSMVPGLGLSAADQLTLLIDRGERLMRRVRFTLEGLEGTRGAVAEVDTAGHVAAHGVLWPTRFHEQLLRPLSLPVHDWRLTGLDVNRGFGAADISSAAFGGTAAVAAALFGG